MPDQRIIARNWVGWCGEKLGAQQMGVSVEQIREWLADLEASANSDGEAKRKKYTPEQKAEALQLLAMVGPTKAARETGISVASLMKWRQEATGQSD